MHGLMSLAYMAELAVVFNLAYAELDVGRYYKQIDKTISDLRQRIPALRTSSQIQQFTRFEMKVEELIGFDFARRYTAWRDLHGPHRKSFWRGVTGSLGLFLFRSETEPHQQNGISQQFNISHEGGADRHVALFFVVLSSLILVLCTALDNWEYIYWLPYLPPLQPSYTHGISIAQLFFNLLLLSMLAPVMLIGFGRKVKHSSVKVKAQLTEELDAIGGEVFDRVVSDAQEQQRRIP